MIKPILKLFDNCECNEIVRFTEDGQTHWALVGDRGNELFILLVLPSNSPPYCENISGQMNIIRRPYEGMPVLSYGKNYSICVDHGGDCDVGGSVLAKKLGAYLITENGDYICCRDDRVRNKTAYFDLKTGSVRGEPGGLRAVFAQWEVCLTDQPPISVLRVQVDRA